VRLGATARAAAEAQEALGLLDSLGGIDSGETALAKIRAGACLVQLYSALVFHGFGLVGRIRRSLVNALRAGQYAGIGDLVGADAAAMTAEPWPE